MNSVGEKDHLLIREGTILIRIPSGMRKIGADSDTEYFDVRTGVQLKKIYPPLQEIELHRGYLLSESDAFAVLRYKPSEKNESKIITLLEIKQRKLDTVVADSILDQLKIIVNILQKFIDGAEKAQKEEKLWLAQQILTLVRKFSGRELEELEEIVDWFNSHPRQK